MSGGCRGGGERPIDPPHGRATSAAGEGGKNNNPRPPTGHPRRANEGYRFVANEKSQNVQDVFLNHVRKNKTPVTVFLVNGVKLQGIITWFDNFSVLLRRDGHTQLVYKHAISTVMPGAPITLFDGVKTEGAAAPATSPSTLTRPPREPAPARAE